MRSRINNYTIALMAGLAVQGCGSGGGSDGGSPAPAPTPALSAPAAAFLSLDLAALANYAAPVLPPYYDAAVLLNDNSPGPASDRLATLGRVLFHDKRLSINDTVSCASCHRQDQGFADPARFSLGFAGTAFTSAHSMRLANLRFYSPGSMFWNKRAGSLEAQASHPLQDPTEMGFTPTSGGIAALLAKMQALPYYPELFAFAFGDSAITEDRMQRALAQFQRAMVSVNSRWDAAYAQVYDPASLHRGLRTPAPGFTPEEDRGRHLFMAALNCSTCHVPPTFALHARALSNGLDFGEPVVFKAPSLKNAGTAGAFMHDGRFSTLEEVVEHYNSGIKDGPILDNRFREEDGTPGVLDLGAADKAALVAFLKTLTDPVLAADAKFSNPFIR